MPSMPMQPLADPPGAMPRRHWGVVLAWLAIPWISACAVTPESTPPAGVPAIVIEGVTIRNELPYTVTDVQILTPASGEFVSCGTILRRSRCATGFSGRHHHLDPVQISWKERGRSFAMPAFVIDVPESMDPGLPARIDVVIYSPGQAGAKLVQP